MNEHFTDFHEDSVERRHQAELEAMPDYGATKPWGAMHCLKCGHGIDMSKHYGRVYHFDRGTDTLHVCKPSAIVLRALLNAKVGVPRTRL